MAFTKHYAVDAQIGVDEDGWKPCPVSKEAGYIVIDLDGITVRFLPQDISDIADEFVGSN